MHFIFITGRRITLCGVLLLFFMLPATAQNNAELISKDIHYTPYHRISEDDRLINRTTPGQALGTGTIHIVAVMAEFEPEENRFTSGNGTFELDYLMRDDIIIDPLPHDRGYFEAHLEFVKNYFDQASFGQLNVEYIVLPEIVQLSEPMREYSPTGPDNSLNFRLGNLARDVWEQVAQMSLPSEIDQLPQDRTMFILFHAGAGRDIELTGTTLDNTPQDIPSVYLSSESIGRLLDEPGFDGFPITENLRVTNTAILPQTQSRRGEDVTGEEFVLELSINGIVTANVGSFIGIPDLFNTNTGASGIGQFGLMDGAGIFSYYGLFPPLPSAWERVYMGWDSAFDVRLDDQEILLPSIAGNPPGNIARHRISADEYFLVENRHRDPSDEGVTLTIRTPNGLIETRTFDNNEERFTPTSQRDFDEILPPGVLINVSNFDWSLPGGLDIGEDGVSGSDDDRILNGGMLIWHIDEAVIRSQMPNNAINNNPDRRGVGLVEADGAQDIGRPALGFSNFSNGGPFDFWWSGNDFTVITPTGQRIVLYENRFADDSIPPNRSNTGSPTYFEFYDFSDNIAISSFRARRAGSDQVELLYEVQLDGNFALDPLYGISWPVTTAWFVPQTSANSVYDAYLLVPSSDNINAIPYLREQGFVEDGYLQFGSGTTTPLLITESVTSVKSASSGFLIQNWIYSDGAFELRWEQQQDAPLNGMPSRGPGANSLIHLDGTPFQFDEQTGQITTINGGFQESGSIDSQTAVIQNLSLSFNGTERNLDAYGSDRRLYAALVQPEASAPAQPLLISDDELILLGPGSSDDITLTRSSFSWPAITDLNQDGNLDYLFVNYEENQLEAKNRNGGFLWNFPARTPEGVRLAGTPLLGDFTGTGETSILVPAADSLSYVILGYDNRLQPLDGFPLYVGSLNHSGEALHQPVFIDSESLLAVVSPRGDLKVWKLGEAEDLSWSRVYGLLPGNKVAAAYSGSAQTQPLSGLLNKSETYNWPNPASTETWIRFQTQTEADITISIASMSGRMLYEQRVRSRGGTAEEVRVDTSGWSSGVYFARVRAQADGREETELIKIAIIR
ncbi:MAG: T9SS type A sorting domain-containing protein [Balneolales bacterium]|nr:T9SS type A sorting domain-containing protein [Balneolales bacterium]